jgi:hypothetical protein
MLLSLARGCLLLLAAALIASPSAAQRDNTQINEQIEDKLQKSGFRPTYTAFPELKPSIEKRVPLPALPAVAADAPLVRKVQLEQLHEGLAYLEEIREVIRVGGWNSLFFQEYLQALTEVFQAAADFEETPAGRVAWYAARVRAFKDFEQFTAVRVLNGNDPKSRLTETRFERLRAEVSLLELLAELEKAGTQYPRLNAEPLKAEPPEPRAEIRKPERPGVADPDAPPAPPSVLRIRDEKELERELQEAKFRPTYTAFPDLKPPISFSKEIASQGGYVEQVLLPRLSAVAADAPLSRKVRSEQLREGLAYLERVRRRIQSGDKVYRLAAELEEKPADQIPWYEARVRNLKEFERFTTFRVVNGVDSRQRLDQARFERLGAEADLLALTAELAPASAKPQTVAVPLCVCPPEFDRPRGWLLMRLFHRR